MSTSIPPNTIGRKPAAVQQTLQTIKVPDVLTYSYENQLVYVVAAKTYDEGIDYAVELFPALKGVDRELISFEACIPIEKGKSKPARIGPMAWLRVVATLKRGDTLTIRVHPRAAASRSPSPALGAPPMYVPAGAVGDGLNEKASRDFLSPFDALAVPSAPSGSAFERLSSLFTRSRPSSPTPSASR
ncbi:hypothetical protein BV25DRAFT_1234528 [Artomyces pyxidatus]|uniref:Uncharacterized protein n=1 Tax=Artomyces pyxidatus TaxID=48021 RepID=A0ACB8SPJ5_9AGAM|nr:hypothetical protein BV25DRAFT_1234528 [Artomyces pyxidatus]